MYGLKPKHVRINTAIEIFMSCIHSFVPTLLLSLSLYIYIYIHVGGLKSLYDYDISAVDFFWPEGFKYGNTKVGGPQGNYVEKSTLFGHIPWDYLGHSMNFSVDPCVCVCVCVCVCMNIYIHKANLQADFNRLN